MEDLSRKEKGKLVDYIGVVLKEAKGKWVSERELLFDIEQGLFRIDCNILKTVVETSSLRSKVYRKKTSCVSWKWGKKRIPRKASKRTAKPKKGKARANGKVLDSVKEIRIDSISSPLESLEDDFYKGNSFFVEGEVIEVEYPKVTKCSLLSRNNNAIGTLPQGAIDSPKKESASKRVGYNPVLPNLVDLYKIPRKNGRLNRVRIRARTKDMQRITELEKGIIREEIKDLDYWKPRNREDCFSIGRPCPYVSCKYHLYLDISPRTGSIKFNFPHLEVWELPFSCALDLADIGKMTLGEIGIVINLTRERVRQIEVSALAALESLDLGREAPYLREYNDIE